MKRHTFAGILSLLLVLAVSAPSEARHYSPRLGRFGQKDALAFTPASNAYAYADNRPVSVTDPLGLFNWDVSIRFLPLENALAQSRVGTRQGFASSGVSGIPSSASSILRTHPVLIAPGTRLTNLPYAGFRSIDIKFDVVIPGGKIDGDVSNERWIKVIAARHEMKHVIALAAFAEEIFADVEKTHQVEADRIEGSTDVAEERRVPTETLRTLSDRVVRPAIQRWRRMFLAQDKELHSRETGVEERAYYQRATGLARFGAGGQQYPLSQWVQWVAISRYNMNGPYIMSPQHKDETYGRIRADAENAALGMRTVDYVVTKFRNALLEEGIDWDDFNVQ